MSKHRHKSNTNANFNTIAAGLAFLCLPLLTTNCWSQDKLPDATELLERHVAETGGREAHLAVRSRVYTGTFTSDIAGHKLKASIGIQSQSPNLRRSVLQGDFLSRIRISDGKNAWEWSAGGTHSHGNSNSAEQRPESTRVLTGPEKNRTLEEGHFYTQIQWQKQFSNVETIGRTTIDDRPAFEVRVTTTQGETYSQFYDESSGRLVQINRTIESSNLGKIKSSSRMSHYRQFGDIWLATRIEQSLDIPSLGKGSQVTEYTEIKQNVELDSQLFQMPEELSKPGNH